MCTIAPTVRVGCGNFAPSFCTHATLRLPLKSCLMTAAKSRSDRKQVWGKISQFFVELASKCFSRQEIMVPPSVEEQIGSKEECLQISLDLGPGNIVSAIVFSPFLSFYFVSSHLFPFLSAFLFPPTPQQ